MTAGPPGDRAARAAARERRVAELQASFFTPALSTTRYQALRELGRGAYGVVVAALDRHTGRKVAVKRIRGCLRTYPMATRALRELKFLRMLREHENIVRVVDILLPGVDGDAEADADADAGGAGLWGFSDTFVVFELMPTDLAGLLKSTTVVSEVHVKYFMFQLLRGVHHMHASNVLHRDLKPSNVLINEACQLRICDLGLARAAFDSEPDHVFWTDYVATRWYRAPELIMEDHTKYSTAIDMWSVGCIFAELLSGGKVLFPGKNGAHQFQLIVDVLGSPPHAVVDRMRNPGARRILADCSNPPRQGCGLQSLFPAAPPAALDVLVGLLVFDQDERMSAYEALSLPYFAEYRAHGLGAPAAPLPETEFEFERGRLTLAEMRAEFLREILTYHPSQTEAVLAEFYDGQTVRRSSSAQVFGASMDAALCAGGGSNAPAAPLLRSMTVEERLLHQATVSGQGQGRAGGYGGRGGGTPLGRRAYPRQHVTMSETELGMFTRQ